MSLGQEEGISGGGTSWAGAGVSLGPTDGSDIIDQVRFVDCISCRWNGPGLSMAGVSSDDTPDYTLSNIEVLGGYYSYNGIESPWEPYDNSGILISGAGVVGVRVVGVTLPHLGDQRQVSGSE